MSCNGCRVLRKGCNENCILRQSLQGIETSPAQGNATVFVAKFFGRAGLMSFLSGVPEPQRPALFQSLLFEACGRTINPVNGAVGLLWTGNWSLCQAAVDTVLRGGVLRPVAEFSSESPDIGLGSRDLRSSIDVMMAKQQAAADLDLCLAQRTANCRSEKRRAVTPSEESGTTTMESGLGYHRHQGREEVKLLQLFL